MDVRGAKGGGQGGDIDAGELPAARYKHVALALDRSVRSVQQHGVIMFSGEAYRMVSCKVYERAHERASERALDLAQTGRPSLTHVFWIRRTIITTTYGHCSSLDPPAKLLLLYIRRNTECKQIAPWNTLNIRQLLWRAKG